MENRRPRGSGSIRSRSGRYEATYSVTDASGVRRRRSKSFSTRTAAREWLTAKQAEVDVGKVFDARGVTLDDYLKTWTDAQADRVEAKTASWYRWAIQKHIIPAMGRMPLERVTPLDVGRLLSEKRVSGAGSTTLRAIRVTLGKAMGDAARRGLIPTNPVAVADRPKATRVDATVKVWTPESIGAFLNAVRDDRMLALWRTSAMTGLRRSELCALTWPDIDLDRAALAVRQAVVMVDGHTHLKAPKTTKSRRSVDLDRATVAVLKGWRRRQIEERLLASEAWHGGEWVFTDQLGKPVNPEWVGKRFRSLVAESGLPVITMRQLRHSHATALLRAGVHPKVVQERLGHSSIGVTLDIYSSVLPTMQREAVERLAALIESR
jgi:integrase